MFQPIFQQFGLSKNESKIYEILLTEGKSGVSDIAKKSKVHRRNVYDSLDRLIEKGVVFEIRSPYENEYQAVNPDKFLEFLEEKKVVLERAMPHLQQLYKAIPHKNEVYVYRGPEGWKNYMHDMLQVADEAHFLGAKGGWLDERVKNFFPQFEQEAQKKKMKFWHLFDHEVKTELPHVLQHVGKNYKFLPKGYSTPAAVDVFGDHVNILSNIHLGGLDENFSFTVIVNQQIADSFRTWFKFMWDFCPEEKSKKTTSRIV